MDASDAVRAAYDAHAGEIYRLGLQVTRSCADAEDVLQESFIRYARHAGPLIGNPRAWLFKTATRYAIDVVRRRSRRAPPGPAKLNGPLADVADRELLERVLDALKELPDRDRAAFVLREMHGFTLAEIADVVGVEPPYLKVLLFRARERLREKLRPILAGDAT